MEFVVLLMLKEINQIPSSYHPSVGFSNYPACGEYFLQLKWKQPFIRINFLFTKKNTATINQHCKKSKKSRTALYIMKMQCMYFVNGVTAVLRWKGSSQLHVCIEGAFWKDFQAWTGPDESMVNCEFYSTYIIIPVTWWIHDNTCI